MKATRPASQTRRVIALLAPCGLALLMGLNAALVLLGVPAPLSGERFAAAHGVLLTVGFLEALVSLESAVSLKRLWAYCAPGALALGALLVLTGLPMLVGQIVMLVGCVLLLANYSVLWGRKHEPVVAVQMAGAFAALGAVIIWTGGVSIPDLFAWLATFLVATIAAERVIIARYGSLKLSATARSRWESGSIVLAAMLALACPLTTIWTELGLRVFAALLIVLAVWLAVGDCARTDLRARGSRRFTGVMVLLSYVWLVVAGVLMMNPSLSGLHYDALLHSLFIGFVMTMVVAHVPTYLPFLLEVHFRFTAGFWVVAAVLNLGLVFRIGADLVGSESGQRIGGVINIAALLGLVAVAVWAAVTKDPASTGKVEA